MTTASAPRPATRPRQMPPADERIWKAPIVFIDSPDFRKTDHAAWLASPPVTKRAEEAEAAEPATGTSRPLLSPEVERHEFRRMNLLKYKAEKLRTSAGKRPTAKQTAALKSLLAEASRVRDLLVESNLRLVIANAKPFAHRQLTMEELLSDGHLALMQAVDKFDYRLGYRFSTYATHAIRRTFYRRVHKWQRDRQRFLLASQDGLEETPELNLPPRTTEQDFALYQELVERMAERLNERELTIVQSRFGLGESSAGAASDTPTLQAMAARLGICKERVRQLQIRALEKLQDLAFEIQRHSPALYNL